SGQSRPAPKFENNHQRSDGLALTEPRSRPQPTISSAERASPPRPSRSNERRLGRARAPARGRGSAPPSASLLGAFSTAFRPGIASRREPAEPRAERRPVTGRATSGGWCRVSNQSSTEKRTTRHRREGGDEARIRVERRNPDEGEPQGLRDGPGFDVEVVEGLDVVRQEPDGRDHDSPRALLCGALELRAQVGPEPAPAAQALALVGDAHWMAER